jgi:hypothetical protein
VGSECKCGSGDTLVCLVHVGTVEVGPCPHMFPICSTLRKFVEIVRVVIHGVSERIVHYGRRCRAVSCENFQYSSLKSSP